MTDSLVDGNVVTLSELQQIAQDMAQKLIPGDVILLSGDLGVGKTAFTISLAQALGAQEEVTSPTFTIVHEYGLHADTVKKLYHLDLYRFTQGSTIDRETKAYITSLITDIEQESAIAVIEWSEALPDITEQGTWHISLEYGDKPDTRHITIEQC